MGIFIYSQGTLSGYVLHTDVGSTSTRSLVRVFSGPQKRAGRGEPTSSFFVEPNYSVSNNN